MNDDLREELRDEAERGGAEAGRGDSADRAEADSHPEAGAGDSAPDAGEAQGSAPPDEGGGEATRAAVDEWKAQVEELQEELEGLNDRHLRLAAEFENYRRRAQGELEESSARAQGELVGQLLEAVDDLQRVGEVDPETTSVEDLLEGIGLVATKLNRILEDAGVEMIDPEGEEFSPATMEAVMKVPTDSPEEDDRVADVFQQGCLFKGRLVRPARVSVRKHD